jgi:hypothetical protein
MSTAAPQQQGLVRFLRNFATAGFITCLGIGAGFALLTGNWIAVPAMILGWLFWHALPADRDAPPGLHFAFSYHLLQIVAGVFYTGMTGRLLLTHTAPQYHLMMVLAVACLGAIFAGFLMGDRWLASKRKPVAHVELDTTLLKLFALYVIALLSNDVLAALRERYPGFVQAIVAISALQLGLYYLVVRRLIRERQYVLVLLMVAFETIRGFTGFYSGFKEPLILALIAGMETFNPRRVTHWALTVGLVLSMLGLSVVWLGIRGEIRNDFATLGSDRPPLERAQFAYGEFRNWWQMEREYKKYDTDALTERVWDIYYTALALDRVPAILPHENGAIISAAIQHVLTPRAINPNKPELKSESEDVIKYAGVKVAGREEGTTIAFGYVIQSYIDFGIPWLVVPCILFGIFLGAAYRFFMTTIHHQEILIAVLAIGFWGNILPYNVAWAKMFGKLLTALVYVGGPAIIFDHFLYTARLRRGENLRIEEQQAARLR